MKMINYIATLTFKGGNFENLFIYLFKCKNITQGLLKLFVLREPAVSNLKNFSFYKIEPKFRLYDTNFQKHYNDYYNS